MLSRTLLYFAAIVLVSALETETGGVFSRLFGGSKDEKKPLETPVKQDEVVTKPHLRVDGTSNVLDGIMKRFKENTGKEDKWLLPENDQKDSYYDLPSDIGAKDMDVMGGGDVVTSDVASGKLPVISEKKSSTPNVKSSSGSGKASVPSTTISSKKNSKESFVDLQSGLDENIDFGALEEQAKKDEEAAAANYEKTKQQQKKIMDELNNSIANLKKQFSSVTESGTEGLALLEKARKKEDANLIEDVKKLKDFKGHPLKIGLPSLLQSDDLFKSLQDREKNNEEYLLDSSVDSAGMGALDSTRSGSSLLSVGDKMRSKTAELQDHINTLSFIQKKPLELGSGSFLQSKQDELLDRIRAGSDELKKLKSEFQEKLASFNSEDKKIGESIAKELPQDNYGSFLETAGDAGASDLKELEREQNEQEAKEEAELKKLQHQLSAQVSEMKRDAGLLKQSASSEPSFAQVASNEGNDTVNVPRSTWLSDLNDPMNSVAGMLKKLHVDHSMGEGRKDGSFGGNLDSYSSVKSAV